MIFLQITNLVEDVVQRLTGKIVTVEGYQAALGCNQGRPGIEIERRRGIDVDRIEGFTQFFQGFPQLVYLVLGLQLALEKIQLRAGGHDKQVLER